jgi:hypothetical protein
MTTYSPSPINIYDDPEHHLITLITKNGTRPHLGADRLVGVGAGAGASTSMASLPSALESSTDTTSGDWSLRKGV